VYLLAAAGESCAARRATFRASKAYTLRTVHETESPDADITDLIRRGMHREAFELILDRYERKVFHLSLSYLRERATAEDIAQDALLRVWAGLPSYDGRSTLSAWITVITRNACLSELRRARRRDFSLDAVAEPPAPRQAGDAQIDCEALLTRLPDAQRQAVTLFYLEGKSYVETARLLDMPINTLRSHLHRARHRMAKMLGGLS
jgi:RNA polymerase sigma-70 factor, ECF subfamily